VKALSGGEKARLLLARLFLKPSNLLVMDEPTNDLDVETLELLEEQLLNYKGTLLVVSHDRTFLDNVTTSCYVLAGDGVVRPCAGGYAEAARLLKQVSNGQDARCPSVRNGQDARCPSVRNGQDARCPSVRNGQDARCPSGRPSQPRKLSYKEQRELEALPGRIEALEGEIAGIEAALGDPALYAKDAARVAALTARLGPAKEELDAAETLWLELSMR
jgi:ATP-binding cassette subfamily F protein uup